MSARENIAAHFTSDVLADELLNAHRAEVLAEAAAPALDALRLIHADMVTCRSGGDEWASEWLGDLWTRLPLALRAAAGDTDAAEELADEDGMSNADFFTASELYDMDRDDEFMYDAEDDARDEGGAS